MTAVPDASGVTISSRKQLPTQGRAPHAAVSRENRIGIATAVIALVMAAFAIVAYGVLAITWRSEPFFGAMVNRSLMVDASIPTSGEAWAGLAAGLQRLDQIVSINGQVISNEQGGVAEFHRLLDGVALGEQIEVGFLRPAVGSAAPIMGSEICSPIQNNAASCTVRYTLGTFPVNDFLAFFLIPYVSSIIVFGVGVVTLVLRPFQPGARSVVGSSALLAIFMAGLHNLNTTHALMDLWMYAAVTMGGAMITFSLLFPIKSSLIYRNTLSIYAPLIIFMAVGLLCAYLYVNPTSPSATVMMQQLALLSGAIGSAVVIGRMMYHRARASTPLIRDQSNTVLIGFLLAFVVVVLWGLNAITRGLFNDAAIPLNTSAAMPFFILPILSMAYAVLQYRAVNTDRVLSQSITYGVMLVALVVGYFLLVLAASLVAGVIIPPGDTVLIAIMIFALAVFFVPVRTRLQERIDRIYYRNRIDYQARVEAFGREIGGFSEFSDIINQYRKEVNEVLLPAHLVVFLPERETGDYVAFPQGETDIRFATTSPMVSYLNSVEEPVYFTPGQPWVSELVYEKPRLHILKALVVTGLRGTNRLNGFVTIGAPRSGKGIYTFEQLRFIENLTRQITVAIERAQVIESLEQRVRELDVLSQVSQAVNFSVNFDDLLELISTQADRLINAPNFYITLRDSITDELYHAFFLEDGERYREKENQRWLLGRDLFSEVVRTNQTIRVANFVQEMARRGDDLKQESTDLKAWVGIPMQAGQRVIGVLSIGTTDPNRSFSEEQLKSFNDIALLAATSIDKSRLFDETNVRARQLAAMNDISRQIVASEGNLEVLLKLITASATDILSAEAGSLLLTTDDTTDDLEFRVAIGGSGADIVGLRVPAGRGLVGEVAKTGKPVIVYDVMTDPRWAGELGKGSFKTNNVIAVPLLAQNRVIGVLEVLNKRGGITFSPTDVELLTTFAGQVAVAIENARLFQMTDMQLGQRVDELEMLERIDIELNRSLDLQKVAEITVEWASQNTGATAALLGLVSGEPPRLEVIYKFGYEDEDMPEGTEGNFYPISNGIVSRVMRTRQAELVPDVTIDPDYVPSLRKAISQITIPMVSGSTIVALLIMETNVEPRFKLADMPFLQRLTEHASIAITNAHLYTELNRANDSKSEFVSFVAHELKNPLTSIRGYADVLLGGAVGGMSDPQRNFLSTIRSNAERMNNLVSDLNDVTKLQTDNMRMDLSPVDFRPVVTETLRPLQKQIEDKEQTLNLKMDEMLPFIKGDQNRLIQVLTNLVSNGHKYTPTGGVVTLEVAVDNHLFDKKNRPLPPMLHIQVRDTGIGMSEEDLDRLFTPYFRSENPLTREQPGTGLGLTITRGIIDRHGGEIWVESRLGEGTVFHFTLPLAEID